MALKKKHEEDKDAFEVRILDLQSKLQERDDNELDQTRAKGVGEKADNSNQVEFSNPAALLKPRLNRWIANNKEKRALMEMYTRNVHIIEDAF